MSKAGSLTLAVCPCERIPCNWPSVQPNVTGSKPDNFTANSTCKQYFPFIVLAVQLVAPTMEYENSMRHVNNNVNNQNKKIVTSNKRKGCILTAY